MSSGERGKPRRAPSSAMQSNCSEAERGPTSQSNNGGSTGHSECDRNQVGSEKDARIYWKMEINQGTKGEGGEEPKEQGTRFATRAGVPAQRLEADTGCPVLARDEQIEELYPRTLDEDCEDNIAARTSSDQDQENGVQTMTKKTEDEDNKEDKNDKDKEGQDGDSDSEEAVGILAAETAAVMMATTDAPATRAADTAASVLDSAHNAAASPARQFNDNLCSDVRLTRAGAGGVLDTPDAGGEVTERAEALVPRSSAGDVKYVAPALQARNHAGLHRGTQSCVSQPAVGTGSTLNIPASAHKRHTPVMNENSLTTRADSVARATSVGAQTVEDGTVLDGTVGAEVTATLRDSQMKHTQTPGAASLATDATVLTVSGGDVSGGDVSGDAVSADNNPDSKNYNDQQQNHIEMSGVRTVARATEYNTLSDDTLAAVKYERLAGAAAMAAVKASTGPMETGDEPKDPLSECCMNAVLNVPMEMEAVETEVSDADEDDLDVAVLDEEVTHQLRLAGTPGGLSDLDKVDTTDTISRGDLSVETASWKKVYSVAAAAATDAMAADAVDTGERRRENAENMIEALAASCTQYQQDYGKRVPEPPEQQQDIIMPELESQTQVAKALANMPDPRTAGVQPAESMNQSSKQLFFLDCFRNVSCVSADGGRSTVGVQPSKQLLFA